MQATDAAVQAFERYTESFQSLAPTRPAAHFQFPSLIAAPDGVAAFARP
jgi:hypothetical protein